MTLLTKASPLIPGLPSNLMDLFNDEGDWGNRWISKVPAANITENDHEFLIELAAPGLQKKDFQVSIENQQITINGTHQKDKHLKDEHYTRREFSYQSFSRSFILPDTVDGDKIKASYQEGVLTVQLPKKEAVKKAPKKQITVG